MWNVKPKVAVVAACATGSLSRSYQQYLEYIPGKQSCLKKRTSRGRCERSASLISDVFCRTYCLVSLRDSFAVKGRAVAAVVAAAAVVNKNNNT
jgi:hypothetical protein